jgi:hypothetical protein
MDTRQTYRRIDTFNRRQYHHDGYPRSLCSRDACVYFEGKRAHSPGTFVELANGTVAMILETDGLDNSGLPHSELPDSLRPKRVKVARLHPFANRSLSFLFAI